MCNLYCIRCESDVEEMGELGVLSCACASGDASDPQNHPASWMDVDDYLDDASAGYDRMRDTLEDTWL